MSPYCKTCHKYAMWPNNKCSCDNDKAAELLGLVSEDKIKKLIGPAWPVFMKFMDRQGYVIIGNSNYFNKEDFDRFCKGGVLAEVED